MDEKKLMEILKKKGITYTTQRAPQFTEIEVNVQHGTMKPSEVHLLLRQYARMLRRMGHKVELAPSEGAVFGYTKPPRFNSRLHKKVGFIIHKKPVRHR